MTVLDGFRLGIGLMGAGVTVFCVFAVVVNIFRIATAGTEGEDAR